MALFADGGVIASKPYAASANYINKMSDYCGGCRYDPKTRTGEDSCPFNALYWDFIFRNEARLKDNSRMSLVLRNAVRIDGKEREAIQERAQEILSNL
jgi:deoxyribodipyrimidine photolyase-related protein